MKAVWLVLVAATLLSWQLGTESGSRVACVAVLIIACVKVRLIGLWFMEVRGAHRALRLFLDLYVVLLGTGMISLYLAG
jgi:caa(3)-type oxidase subunit IV